MAANFYYPPIRSQSSNSESDIVDGGDLDCVLAVTAGF